MKLSSVIYTCRTIISQFLVLVVILLNTISGVVDPTLPKVQVDDFTEVSSPYKLLLRTTCITAIFFAVVVECWLNWLRVMVMVAVQDDEITVTS